MSTTLLSSLEQLVPIMLRREQCNPRDGVNLKLLLDYVGANWKSNLPIVVGDEGCLLVDSTTSLGVM